MALCPGITWNPDLFDLDALRPSSLRCGRTVQSMLDISEPGGDFVRSIEGM